jgi:hypothetical protein
VDTSVLVLLWLTVMVLGFSAFYLVSRRGEHAPQAFDTTWRSLIPAALVLCAGLVAYAIEAAGASGPNFVFGREDANASIARAWIQLPLHAGLALLLVIGRPRGWLWLAWAPARAGLILLLAWAAFLAPLVIGQGVVYVGVLGLAALMVPSLLYAAALYLTLENGARHARALLARLRQGPYART